MHTKTHTDDAPDFNLAYFRSRNVLIQRMMEIRDPKRRAARALQLAREEAMIIDKQIDVDLAGAWNEMTRRTKYGQRWVGNMLMPPTDGATYPPPPPGAILTSLKLTDYPPIHPPRTFTMAQYFKTMAYLSDLSILVTNPDRHMILPCDAEDATVDMLLPPAPNDPVAFPGALAHYGLAVAGTGRVYDAEILYDFVKEDDVDGLMTYLEAAPLEGS